MADASAGVYRFSNGIRLYRADLLDVQLARYAEPGNPNLHEPVEEDWIRRMLDRIATASPVFVDVGAAMGYYCVLVKQLRPAARIFAVEALPRHVSALRATLALNGLAPTDVTVMQVAVSPETGKASFVDQGYGSQLSSATVKRHDAVEIEVEARSLKAILAEIGPVDLMKMDIQGAEREVLGAARGPLSAGAIAHAIVGTHGREIHESVRAILEQAKFSIDFDDPAPAMQPDGLIVASFTCSTDARRTGG
jgi:FkbM family methyltransferase